MKPGAFRIVSLLGVGFVLLAITAAVSAATAGGSFTRSLTVTGPVELDVTTGSGNIVVRAGGSGTVSISARIRARGGQAEEKVRRLEANPPIEQEGNTIRIGYLEDRWLQRKVSISYELTVPRDTRLRSRTGSGDQEIDGVRGPVIADTGSGSLTVSGIGDDVEAATGSGSIEITDVAGRTQLSTGSGSIRGDGLGGAISARTGSGSIRLEQAAAGDVEASTGSGGIAVRGVHGSLRARTGSGSIEVDGEPTGEWRLDTSSGNIEVRLPTQASFDLQAQTSSGSIDVDHPLTVRGRIGRRQVQGKVRGGGVLIVARTSSGNIRIE